MSRYTGPKEKKIKRFERSQAQNRRMSSYSKQLLEKQKVKFRYGIREKQFKNLYEEAVKINNIPTGTAILQMLEQRLDNVVYRLGLARSRPQARQFVHHGRVLVDGNAVTIPSYRVKPGEQVTLTREAFRSSFVQSILEKTPLIPGWLEVSSGVGTILRSPDREEMDKDIDENLIVAFYSR